MKTLILLLLVALSMIAKAEYAFTPVMGHMSVDGQARFQAQKITGQWLSYDDAWAVLRSELPVSFSKEAHYMSRDGYVRWMAEKQFVFQWIDAREAVLIVAVMAARARGKIFD